ncbi:MAG: 50S ribosomal protein L20 [Acholeplasmatales bacterium]|nr:MAG: 50S ribosomal protein L20 [Acholeplasmatales bacterium]
MPRVKGGNVARKRRRKILKLAKGYFGSKHLLYKTAHEQVMKSLAYSYRDRKQRKRDFRKLWITRINAAARLNGLSYSRMINGLALAGVDINRKMLADIAVADPQGFAKIVDTAKRGLNGDIVREEVVVIAKASNAPTTGGLDQEALEAMTVADLKELCKERDIEGYSALKKAEIVALLLES